jgi:hypothetical protein
MPGAFSARLTLLISTSGNGVVMLSTKISGWKKISGGCGALRFNQGFKGNKAAILGSKAHVLE